MPKINEQTKLRNFFNRHRVVKVNDLFEFLQSKSRMTVFRKLRMVEYLSSYTHAGKYYTLDDIPRFDSNGIWCYENICFSQRGTLKNTVKYIVNSSECGKFHFELEYELKIRVQNALLDLIKNKEIDRTKQDGKYLYVSINKDRKSLQIKHRHPSIGYSKILSPSISNSIIIEVLVEVIRQHRKQPDAEKVTSVLNKKGIPLTIKEVVAIFDQYDIEKKTLDLD